MRITRLEVTDLRFLTSRDLDGSDAMNPAPDYSAAYVVLSTDGELEGHGFTFTIGRGNEVCVAAVHALEPLAVGLDLDAVVSDLAGVWRRLVGDSQLRWIGPEKGAIHLAAAAVVNALWDLYAKREGEPLWKLLVDMEPEELVACIDFGHLTDAITPEAMGEFQIDACRLGGIKEVLAVLLLAAKYDVPVCPHAGGIGLREYVQHLAMFDHIAVASSGEGRFIEYADHLHEHFVDPVRVVEAHCLAPEQPGYSAQMHCASIERFRFPDGEVWRDEPAWEAAPFEGKVPG